jgi:hypothetical protein
VQFPGTPFPPSAKVPAIAQFVADRAVAWVDDDHADEAWEWARLRAAPTLLLPVDPAVGLTAAHIERLRGWVA